MKPSYFDKHLFQPIQISEPTNSAIGLIVVIPCFNEPDILSTLNSLANCNQPKCTVEIILVINASENTDKIILATNQKCYNEAKAWKIQHLDFKLFILRAETLPVKHAGVGLARKIGLDEAAFRFSKANRDNGILVCLDADCTVTENYFEEIENYYTRYPETKATSIHFEHPLTNLTDNHKLAIIEYELYLRVYIQALRYSKYPYAFHTIGSSMTVRSDIYTQQGGMNRKKAGEDFYFLHKIMPLGNFGEINQTTVHPSARTSNRVPFGTGKAMQDQLNAAGESLCSYNIRIFDDLKFFIQQVDELYGLIDKQTLDFLNTMPATICRYFDNESFITKVQEINKHTANAQSFHDRFLRWFDGLQVLKFVHYSRDNFYPNKPITTCANDLLKRIEPRHKPIPSTDLLNKFRKLDPVKPISF